MRRVPRTQALRQSLLKKYAAIRAHMDQLHNSRMSPYEKLECLDAIRCEIQVDVALRMSVLHEAELPPNNLT